MRLCELIIVCVFEELISVFLVIAGLTGNLVYEYTLDNLLRIGGNEIILLSLLEQVYDSILGIRVRKDS